jgi:glutathione synthase
MKHNRKARKPLQIAFIMDEMEKLLFWEDTSISIMEEARRHGHQIFYIEPKDIFFRNTVLHAEARLVDASLKNGVQTLAKKTIALDSLDIVFNRKEPPFDLSYLYLTQLLELLVPDVFVINAPRGIRKANEKLYILEFPKWIPPTIVANDPLRISRFQKEHEFDLILKPLDQKGGAGICLLPWKSRGKNRLLTQMTCVGTRWIIAQKFLKKNLTQGDKRILLLNGKVLGQFTRIPKEGEFRSNLSLGGKKECASLTAREKKLVQSIKPKLLRDGLYFVGLDIVDGHLIEINVTSPAGIPEINELEEKHLETRVVDFLERRAKNRAG